MKVNIDIGKIRFWS